MKKYIIAIGILLTITLSIAVSYGLWTMTGIQEEKNIVQTTCFKAEFFDNNGVFQLNKAYPMTNEEGLKLNPYEFSIKNNCTDDKGYYAIYVAVADDSTLNKKFVNVNLDDEVYNLSSLKEFEGISGYSKMYLIKTKHLDVSETLNHEFRMWLDYETTLDDIPLNPNFSTKIVIRSSINDLDNSIDNTKYIASLAKNNSEMFTDDYGNIRYFGSNPNNYLQLGGEEWRVIGVVDGYVKIVKANLLGEMAYGESTNWSKSSLQEYLNNDYLNTIGDSANYLENFVWKLGTYSENASNDDLENRYIQNGSGDANLSKYFYNWERSDNTLEGNDLTWQGKVGLLYPSDYGYASSGTILSNGYACRNYNLDLWRYENCGEKNYLFHNDFYWLLTPDVSGDIVVFRVSTTGEVYAGIGYYGSTFYDEINVLPAAYLRKDVKIAGSGIKDTDPFIIVD